MSTKMINELLEEIAKEVIEEEKCTLIYIPIQEDVVLQFFSKSKKNQDIGQDYPANWRNILSNFHQFEIEIDGNKYPSIEHYFHAEKFRISSKPSVASNFMVGGSVGPDTLDAKRAGGKAGFKREGVTLDIKKWNSVRDEVMTKAVMARIEQDEEYKRILLRLKDMHVVLLHFDRGGSKSYWGGKYKDGEIMGENKLGKIMMDLW